MGRLGDFGQAHDLVDASFGYFGKEIRVNPEFSELDVVDLMDAAKDMKEDDPRSAALVKDTMRSAVHPEDFDVFWSLAKSHRQDIDDLFLMTEKIIEGIAENPTSQPSDSSGGRRKTKRKSKRGSYSRALTLLEDRPDLQEAVVLRREARPAG